MLNRMNSLLCVSLCLLGCQMVFGARKHFMVLNDIHYDPTYWTTQESCNSPVPKDKLGPYGHFECDAPWELVDLAMDGLEYFESNYGAPEFLVWLGDNAHHPVNYSTSMLNNETMLEILTNITEKLTYRDFDGNPRQWLVLPVLGNHDWYPTNQLPGGPSERYNQLADLWQRWLTVEAQETFKLGGYYSMVVNADAKFRAVVLNTCLYLPGNHLTENIDDPANQFEWFESVLASARTNDEMLHIFSHIPSGLSESDESYYNFRPNQATIFNNLIRQYSDVILALHAVHIHTDSFRLFYKDDVPVATEFISPALVPWRCRVCDPNVVSPRNPALRLVEYDDSSKNIQDIYQYYFHLPQANTPAASVVPEWIEEYRFRTYGIPTGNIDPQAVHNVLESFKPHGSNKFHEYYRHNTVNVSGDVFIPCDCTCKQRHLCALQYVEYDEHAQCIEENFAVCGASAILPALFIVLMSTVSTYIL